MYKFTSAKGKEEFGTDINQKAEAWWKWGLKSIYV